MLVDERPLLLSLETATRAGSIAITRGAKLLAARTGDAQVSHSTHLLEQIKSALAESELQLREIDFFAVATGPGSFTGLRIGLATVKALAATLERLCAGVPTLNAIALSAGASSRTMALLPAGRGELFAQQFAVSQEGFVQPLDAPMHLAPDKLLKSVAQVRALRWTGEGAHLYADAIRDCALRAGIEFRVGAVEDQINEDEKLWTLVKDREVLAASVAHLARLQIQAGAALPAEEIKALYVRPSDAELKEH